MNGLQHRVTTINVAVGSEASVAYLVAPHGWASGGHVEETELAPNHDDRVQSIAVSRLDTILASLAVSHVDFIKIDTEGYEAKVLEGAGDLLDQRHLKILLEWSLPQLASRSDPAALLQSLRARAFKIGQLLHDGSTPARTDAEILACAHTDLYLYRD